MINDKKLRQKVDELYYDLVDTYVETSERVARHKLTKGEAITTLTAVLGRGRKQYSDIKKQNPSAEAIFIESDKKMNKLFGDMQSLVEKYSADLTMQN